MNALFTMLLAAHASGVNADTQLMREDPAAGALPGMAAPADVRGAWSFKLSAQYESAPLVMRVPEGEFGSIVGQRLTGALGGSWQPHDRVRLGVSLPLVGQWQGEVAPYAQNGFGPGDLAVHVMWSAVRADAHQLGFSATVFGPTGRKNAWVSERLPHADIGANYALTKGPLELHAMLGADLRALAAADVDPDLFTRGTAGLGKLGARWQLPADLALLGLGHTRFSSESLIRPGERVLGVMAGLEHRSERNTVRMMAGRGLMGGVGSPDLRVMVSLAWKGGEPVLEQAVLDQDLGEEFVDEPDEDPVEAPAEEVVSGTRMEGKRIIVTEPILFFVNTARLKPESEPAMRAIASVLADTPAIGHLVIEGHASAEGSFAYNYDLSARRARSVWEALLEKGVHPDRISYRGLGEVSPAGSRGEEVIVEEDRRVEFRILYLTGPLDGGPEHPQSAPIPWSGSRVATPRAEWSPEDIAAAEQAVKDEEARIRGEEAFVFTPPPAAPDDVQTNEVSATADDAHEEPVGPLTPELENLDLTPAARDAQFEKSLHDALLARVQPQFQALSGELEPHPYAVRLRLVFEPDGSLRRASLVQTSGSAKVDGLALEAVKQGLPRAEAREQSHAVNLRLWLTPEEVRP
ncbi:MAG: OmpA family protein [Proteobacteria bacterium]|nr:OmpA family protein [Pseudomonadota bacterium]